MAAVAAFDKFNDFTFEFFIGNEKTLSGIFLIIFWGMPFDSEPKIKYALLEYCTS